MERVTFEYLYMAQNGWLDAFVKNIDPVFNQSELDFWNVSRAEEGTLNFAFQWERTSQGHEFWMNVDEAISCEQNEYLTNNR